MLLKTDFKVTVAFSVGLIVYLLEEECD